MSNPACEDEPVRAGECRRCTVVSPEDLPDLCRGESLGEGGALGDVPDKKLKTELSTAS